MTISLDRLLADGCTADTKHKLCRSRGGESCAFDGAAIVLMPIADAAHIVHGPINCVANAWEGRGVLSTVGDMHRRGFTSDLAELDIVYGGERRLEATVREVVAKESPAAVFVYSTCVTGLIGEDVDAVCRRLSSELWVPVISVPAPGFVGPKNLGNRIAGDVLVENVIGTAEPDFVTPTDITLIGEYNVAGDLDLVESLLEECGIRVLSRVTGNASFGEIRHAHRSKLAAVVCSRALINVASSLSRKWGVPAVEVSFFGATEIAASLRTIAESLEAVSPEARGVREKVEEVIRSGEQWLSGALEPYRDLRGRKAVLYSGGVKSWSMASALKDLGVEVIAVGTKKSSHEDEEKARAVLGDDVPLIEDISPARIRRLFAEEGAELLVAGGRNRYLAAKEGWPFVDVNQEREHAYAGYEGLVNLAKDLAATVSFHEAQQDTRVVCPAPAPHAQVIRHERSGLIDPLKNAPTTGALLALQGVDGAIPVLHSAQGCSFLGKVLMIRHFNEPIALATSNLFTEDVVLGSEEALERTLMTHLGADPMSGPHLVAVVAGALSEVKGDDVDAVVRKLDRVPDRPLIAVHAPDYLGGLEEGYASAVAALVSLAEERGDAPVDQNRVAVLAGAHLTPGDLDWLRDVFEEFRLHPVFVPDIGALDGSREGFSPYASGGVNISELRRLGECARTLVFGASLEPAARDLQARFGTPYTLHERVHGLAATDLLMATLCLLSGSPVPDRHERRRRMLIDAMRDAHQELSGSRVTIAVEPDHAVSLASLFGEVAAPPDVIIPTAPAHASWMDSSNVIVGDYADTPCDTELLVSGSHGRRTADSLGAAHLETGFPVFASYGASRVVTLGYEGATAMIDAAANALITRERSRHLRPDHQAGSVDQELQPTRRRSEPKGGRR